MKGPGLNLSGIDKAERLLWPIAAMTGALALWWFRFDYSWATGDQDEFVPYLLHLIDPSLLAADWFVQTQSEAVSVRTPFVFLLRVLCYVTGPQYAILTVFVVAWFAIGWSVFRLTEIIGNNIVGAVAAVIIVLALTPKWTLGGNDVVYAMLVPEMAAWAVGLPGLIALFRNRWLLAGCLIAISGWLQLLVGLHLLILIALCGIPDLITDFAGWRRRYLVSIATGLLLISPILAVIVSQQLGQGGSTEVDLLWVLAHYRAPYHYLPSAFPPQSYLKFFVLLFCGGASVLWLRRTARNDRDIQLCVRILFSIGVCVAIAAVLTEVIPVAPIVKLQLYKTTVVAKLLLISLACAAVGITVARRVVVPARRYVAVAVTITALIRLAAARLFSGPLLEDAETDSLERWARASTNHDDRFMIPPSVSSFRSRAQRPIVVNYAAVPFAPNDMAEWYRRLQEMAPVENPVRGIALKTQLDSAFHRTETDELVGLAEKYDVRYLARRADEIRLADLPIAYQDSVWVVYNMSSDSTD
ncbi:MAG: DUF6798 domain-containing protein [Rhodothermales bacterium]|nr:DUF6798 domain-containing protein [Rhodothermales bacterium]